jgi:uncharacterized zinc-type alcohol dehydrogenase-like protein
MLQDRKSLGMSHIGSIRDTQEVLEFCAEHRIAPEIKVISADGLNDAFEKKVDKGEVDLPYVIDMATLRDKQPDHGLAAAVGL